MTVTIHRSSIKRAHSLYAAYAVHLAQFFYRSIVTDVGKGNNAFIVET
jgi:hypothetical protein